jgi:hypothetical protein
VGQQRDARASAALHPPPIAFHGARWSSDEFAAIAAGWLEQCYSLVFGLPADEPARAREPIRR